MAFTVEQSRTIPVSVENAFKGTMPAPLPTLFRRWYGPIPPISGVRDQTGDWSTVGESRTLILTGGGTMREQLTRVDPPRSFGYTISNITGPLSALASSIDGVWSFEPAGTGTRVGWQWTIHPRYRLGAAALPVFGWLWRGYAAQALEDLSDRLTE